MNSGGGPWTPPPHTHSHTHTHSIKMPTIEKIWDFVFGDDLKVLIPSQNSKLSYLSSPFSGATPSWRKMSEYNTDCWDTKDHIDVKKNSSAIYIKKMFPPFLLRATWCMITCMFLIWRYMIVIINLFIYMIIFFFRIDVMWHNFNWQKRYRFVVCIFYIHFLYHFISFLPKKNIFSSDWYIFKCKSQILVSMIIIGNFFHIFNK